MISSIGEHLSFFLPILLVLWYFVFFYFKAAGPEWGVEWRKSLSWALCSSLCVTTPSRPRTHRSLRHLFFLGSPQHSLKPAPEVPPPFLESQRPFSGQCCSLGVLCGHFFLGLQPAHRVPQGFSTSTELQAFLWPHCGLGTGLSFHVLPNVSTPLAPSQILPSNSCPLPTTILGQWLKQGTHLTTIPARLPSDFSPCVTTES